MPTLIDNLNLINSYKSDIKSAIENKGVDMTGVSFGGYAEKIGEIETGGTFVTEVLSVSQNGTYYPGQGVDGFSQVDVNVPQSVEGYTDKQLTERDFGIVNLNNSASYVGRYAFYGTNTLKTVDLPNCVTLQMDAFYSCSFLNQVSVPNCTSVESAVFQLCRSLYSINLPKCEFIGSYGFYNDWSLSEVSLPVCSAIGNYVFGYCSSLTTLSLPDCRSVGGNAFQYCVSLTEIYLPFVSSFGGNYVFANCSNLESLTLCTEVYVIPACGNRMFSSAKLSKTGSIYVASDMYSRWIVSTGWSSMAARFVSVNQAGPVLSYDNGLVYGITRYLDNSCLSYLGVSKADVVSISLSNSIILETNFSAFRILPNLTSLSLPNIVSINNQCFMNCSSLKELYAPECKYIGQTAFQSCNSLSQVNISKCEYVGISAFQNCRSLSQVNLPVCSYIGNLAFNMNPLSLTIGYSGIVQCDGNQPVSYSNTVSIYVPSSLVNEYKTTHPWSNYSSQIFPIPE